MIEHKKPIVAFRCDGDSTIGLGHLVRCLALSEIISPYFGALFIVLKSTVEHLKALIPEAKSFSLPIIDAECLGNIPENLCAVVFDGYNFDNSYLCQMRQIFNKPQIVIDDSCGNKQFNADIIINPDPHFHIPKYGVPQTCSVYTGLDYAILRKDFKLERCKDKVISSKINNVMICFGGADINGHTLRAMKALFAFNCKIAIDIVVGSANPHTIAIQNLIQEYVSKGAKYTYHNRLMAADFSALLSRSDLFIGPSSTVAIESMCMGVPMIIYPIAENQQDFARWAEANNVAIVEDDVLIAMRKIEKAEVRAVMSKAQRTHLDGHSDDRLLQICKNICLLDCVEN